MELAAAFEKSRELATADGFGAASEGGGRLAGVSRGKPIGPT